MKAEIIFFIIFELLVQDAQGWRFRSATPTPTIAGCATGPSNCPPTRYRSVDGSCNNLLHADWGMPQTRFRRLSPAKYGDGISTPPKATNGQNLPDARNISLLFYPDVEIEDPKFTMAAMEYGQIITHDMSLAASPPTQPTSPTELNCCTADGQINAQNPPSCYPIVMYSNDPQNVNTTKPVTCMNFVRTETDKDRNCVGGKKQAEQITVVNAYLDLSLTYGNTVEWNNKIRAYKGGKMITEIRNRQEWPPPGNDQDNACSIQTPQDVCYNLGDVRANQSPPLTNLQIILLREHNRIAGRLAKINPHWDDETLFQEARKINIGQHQYITYQEWLPLFIGRKRSLQQRIIYDTKNYVDDYDPTKNPAITNEHATAEFRFFHTLIAGRLDLVTESRSINGTLRLSDWYNRAGTILEQGNVFDDLTRGQATQAELMSDRYHDSEITQFLLRYTRQYGQDLKAIDIQRGRDHGLASYNDLRAHCGLKRAAKFEDFLDVIAQDNVNRLASVFNVPDDVDLALGGSLEKLVDGSLLGPTFLCIIIEQFQRTRISDRFFYERSGSTGFTLSQLNEIRKASISRLFCDNGRNIKTMQPRGFEKISDKNKVVPCEELPAVNLNLWKEPEKKKLSKQRKF